MSYHYKKLFCCLFAATVQLFVFNLSGQNIVGEWYMNEGAGSVINDSSGNNISGTLTGMNTSQCWVAGENGTAVEFDGSQGYIALSSSSLFDITDEITIEAWVYLDDNSFSELGRIVQKGAAYGLYMSTKGEIVFYTDTRTDNGTWTAISSPLEINKWYHIAGTYNGSQMFLYVNGVLVDSDIQSGKINVQTNNLCIGGDSSTAQIFSGRIDTVRIYDFALSKTQIRSICSVAKYELNESSGTTAASSCLYNSCDGTLLSMDSGCQVAGIIGNALLFNGSSGCVACGNDNIFSNLNAITLQAWIKPESLSPSEIGRVIQKNSAWGLYQSTNGMIYFYVDTRDNNGVWKALSYTLPSAGKWYHVAGTYDGSVMKLYINGEKVAEDALSGEVDTVSSGLYIGANSSTSQVFDGTVDEVEISMVVLNEYEIYNSYASAYLVGQWNFNLTINNVVNDLSLFDNDASLSSFITSYLSISPEGQALKCDGVQGVASCGNDSSFNIEEEITLEAWVYLNTITPSILGRIIQKAGSYGLYQGTNGVITFYVDTGNDNGSWVSVSSSSLTPGKWYHITGVYDGSQMDLYVNGNLASSSSQNGKINVGTASLRIGANSSTSQAFDGNIDNVKIYSKSMDMYKIKKDNRLFYPYIYNFDFPTSATGYYVAKMNYMDEIDIDTAPVNASFNSCSISATPGEYEPFSFVLYALDEDVQNISITVSDLTKGSDVISSSNIVVREVLIAPERNTLDSYVDEWTHTSRHLPIYSAISLSKKELRQIIVTVKVPDTAVAGIYTGTVTIAPQNKNSSTISLSFEVLPFSLVNIDDYKFGMYYIADLANSSKTIAEIQDIIEHGCNFICPLRTKVQYDYDGINITPNYSDITSTLSMFQQAGFTGEVVIGLNFDAIMDLLSVNYDDQIFLDAAYDAVNGMLAIKNQFSTMSIILTDLDEIFSHSLVDEYIGFIQAAQQVSGWEYYVTIDTDDNYDIDMAATDSYIDLRCYNGKSLETYLADNNMSFEDFNVEVTNSGDTAMIYHNPRGVWHNAEWERIISGLYMWKNPIISGRCQCIYSKYYENPLDDLDGPQEAKGHDWGMAFPDSINGITPVPTKKWEAWREGLDDLKYILTLENAIATNPLGKAQSVLDAAQAYLDSIKNNLPNEATLSAGSIESAEESPYINAVANSMTFQDYEDIRDNIKTHIKNILIQ